MWWAVLENGNNLVILHTLWFTVAAILKWIGFKISQPENYIQWLFPIKSVPWFKTNFANTGRNIIASSQEVLLNISSSVSFSLRFCLTLPGGGSVNAAAVGRFETTDRWCNCPFVCLSVRPSVRDMIPQLRGQTLASGGVLKLDLLHRTHV